MGSSRLRIVILSNIPEVVEMTATTLLRLGHEPVAAVAAQRRKPTPGLTSFDADISELDIEILMAPDRNSLEPVLRSLRPDLVLSWAFPWRVPERALAVPGYGSINFHPSLLPRHRGANPVAWTIRLGDPNYGVTWHRMESQYDSGPILAQRSTPVLVDDTIFDVVPRLCTLGVRMLRGVLDRVSRRDRGEPQPTEGATDAGPFGDDYASIDWSMPVRAVHDQVRAWSFTPGTHSVVGPIGEVDGKMVRVIRTSMQRPDCVARLIQCGDGPLWILETELVD